MKLKIYILKIIYLEDIKKYALCFSGELRTFEETYENFFENFSNIINNSDIYLHLWKEDNYERAKEIYNPKDYIVEETPEQLFLDINDKFQINKKHDWQKYIPHMFYAIKAVNDLKKRHEEINGRKYNAVFRLRYDYKFRNNKFSEEYLDNLEENTLYLSNISYNWCGLCDQFALGTSKIIDSYSLLFDNFDYLVYEKLSLFHPETLLKIYIEDLNYMIKYLGIHHEIIRPLN